LLLAGLSGIFLIFILNVVLSLLITSFIVVISSFSGILLSFVVSFIFGLNLGGVLISDLIEADRLVVILLFVLN